MALSAYIYFHAYSIFKIDLKYTIFFDYTQCKRESIISIISWYRSHTEYLYLLIRYQYNN